MNNPDKLPTALNLPQVDSLPQKTAKYFELCKEKLGLVPNVLLAYSFNIDKLNAFTSMYNDLMLADSGISKLEREMIAVVVSSINQCFYCLVAHGAAVRELSKNPELGEMLVMNHRICNLEPRQRTMVDFTEKVTLASNKITESDREELRKVGFTDRDIWDIIAVAGFFNMTNRVASATAMMPNPEYHSASR